MKKILISLTFALALVTSCRHNQPVPDSRPAQATGEALERAKVHNESTQTAVSETKTEITKPSPSIPVAVAHLDTAKTELTAQTKDLDDAKAALNKTQAERDQLVQQIQAEQLKYQKLEAKWYVRLGRWVERLLAILIGVYVLCGVLTVLLPQLGMLGLSREIVRFVPAMNAFAWVRDFVASRKAAGGNQP